MGSEHKIGHPIAQLYTVSLSKTCLWQLALFWTEREKTSIALTNLTGFFFFFLSPSEEKDFKKKNEGKLLLF